MIDGNSVLLFESGSFDRYGFRGFNVNLGMQLQLLHDTLTLGAVLKTPFEADIRHDSSYHGRIYDPNDPGFESKTDYPLYTTNEKLDMPISFGIGAAYRISHGFTLSLDIYRTEWGRCVLKDAQGNRTSLITGRPLDESAIRATHQIRMGAEYFIMGNDFKIALRAGIFYDPAPAPGNPDDFYGVSYGFGFKGKGLDFDIAYQYRWGRGVNAYLLPDMHFSQDVQEHFTSFSLIYHFGKRHFF
jgi:long-subunit fatty acid transport protein